MPKTFFVQPAPAAKISEVASVNIPAFFSADEIRTRFSFAMSEMYRTEVPLYGDLIEIVEDVNGRTLVEKPALARELEAAGELPRLSVERHGAIRVGTAQELSLMRRAFAIMGMYPVGYYDLAVAGVPVHSTAFRPTEEHALRRNPFRVFTSLLRLELIDDPELRAAAAAILLKRRIFTDRALRLIEMAEEQGGLEESDASKFVAEILETFRWHSDALVNVETYERLHASHRLIADIVSFRGPHINHLTPRTLDIDAVQAEMFRRGIDAKAVIEGPPRRSVPILLRQTSFKAIEELIRFAGSANTGLHTARFGEIEQRGIALTRKGRDLYDRLLAQARGCEGSQARDYARTLASIFTRFPDTMEDLRKQELAFFRYFVTPSGRASIEHGICPEGDLEDWISAGLVMAEPIVYEDFLPVSAAGIFQSNLGGSEQRTYSDAAEKQAFERALGGTVHDPLRLYEDVMQASIVRIREELSEAAANAANSS